MLCMSMMTALPSSLPRAEGAASDLNWHARKAGEANMSSAARTSRCICRPAVRGSGSALAIIVKHQMWQAHESHEHQRHFACIQWADLIPQHQNQDR